MVTACQSLARFSTLIPSIRPRLCLVGVRIATRTFTKLFGHNEAPAGTLRLHASLHKIASQRVGHQEIMRHDVGFAVSIRPDVRQALCPNDFASTEAGRAARRSMPRCPTIALPCARSPSIPTRSRRHSTTSNGQCLRRACSRMAPNGYPSSVREECTLRQTAVAKPSADCHRQSR